MKKVAIVGTNGLPGRYGGWDQLLNHLVAGNSNDFTFYVYTSTKNRSSKPPKYNGANLIYVSLNANGFQSVIYDGITLIHAAFKFDTILVLGVSGAIFFPFLKIFKKKIILNPDGAEWKRGKWNKFIKTFLKFSEFIGLKFADEIIADNIVLKNYFKKKYGLNSTMIPYGGNHVKAKINLSKEMMKKLSIQKNSYAFKVCRIVPENNLDMILDAFTFIKMDLIVVGNWDNSTYGKNLKNKYKMYPNINLLDPIYNQNKLDELRSNCKFYIHGHSVGGTNPSLVEAMYLSLLCVVFDVSFNIKTTHSKALYFKNKDDLIKIINMYIKDKQSLRIEKIKNSLHEIAKKEYDWSIIVEKYNKLF